MKSPTMLSKRPTSLSRNLSGSGSGTDPWGMGFFLVFFPQDKPISLFKSPTLLKPTQPTRTTTILAKAHSTISVCAIVVFFFTLLLFTLCTFEPTISNNTNYTTPRYRRQLSQLQSLKTPSNSPYSPALHRLGTLYSRGTKQMNHLVIAHVPDPTSVSELKSFLRAFHRSGLLSKSDLLFVFPSITTPEFSDSVIRDEHRSFLKIIRRYQSEFSNISGSDFPASFDVSQFVKSGGNSSEKEPIWGRKVKSNSNSSSLENDGGEYRLSYGSVVGFGVGEVDPENSLSGFVDVNVKLNQVPLSLRRWATYPMILGRVRRNYKHVMLVDVKEVLLLHDPFPAVKISRPETVFLSTTLTSHAKHHRKTTVNPSVIIGGARGVRRLSAAVLTEIVRATTMHKKKTPVTEPGILTRLVTSEFVKRNLNIDLVESAELVTEASSLGLELANSIVVVRRGNSNLDIELTKHICSFRIDASVYTECRKVQPF